MIEKHEKSCNFLISSNNNISWYNVLFKYIA